MSAEDLTLSAVPMVHDIVREVSGQLPSVSADELLSAGLVALMDAARRFDPAIDGDFDVYARALVRSALLVDLRSSEHDERPTPEDGAADLVGSEEWTAGLRAAIDSLSIRHRQLLDALPGNGPVGVRAGGWDDDYDYDIAARVGEQLGAPEAEVIRLRAEALMVLRDSLRPATDVDPMTAGRDAARQASYAAVGGRRALLQASVMADVDDLPREA